MNPLLPYVWCLALFPTTLHTELAVSGSFVGGVFVFHMAATFFSARSNQLKRLKSQNASVACTLRYSMIHDSTSLRKFETSSPLLAIKVTRQEKSQTIFFFPANNTLHAVRSTRKASCYGITCFTRSFRQMLLVFFFEVVSFFAVSRPPQENAKHHVLLLTGWDETFMKV